MKREHVAVLVLLLLLVVALATVGLGQIRPTTITIDEDGGGEAAGRHVDLAEIDAGCLSVGPPPIITPPPLGTCTVAVGPTDVPAWDAPVVARWLPREPRRLDLELVATDALAACTTTLDVTSGSAAFEVDLDARERDERSASLAVDPSGAVVVVAPAPGCVLRVG